MNWQKYKQEIEHTIFFILLYIYIYVFVLPAIVPLIIVIPVVFPTEINCLPDRNNHSNDDFTVVAAAAATAAVNDFGVVVLAEREDYHFWCCNCCCYSRMNLIDCTSSCCCFSRTNLIDCTSSNCQCCYYWLHTNFSIIRIVIVLLKRSALPPFVSRVGTISLRACFLDCLFRHCHRTIHLIFICFIVVVMGLS